MSRTIQRQFYIGKSSYSKALVFPTWITVNHYFERGKWRLSITGVEGPKSNGDCEGGCGQNIDTVTRLLEAAAKSNLAKLALPAPTLERLVQVWEAWHLNDMRAACAHQYKAKGPDLYKMLKLYTWRLSPEASKRQSRLEREVVNAAIGQQELNLSEDERGLLALKHLGMATLTEDAPTQWHVLDKIEEKNANWVRFTPSTEPQPWTTNGYGHPEGMLGKPCDVCDYRYGTAWLYEPVPEDVLDFLETLPHTPPSGGAWVENFKR